MSVTIHAGDYPRVQYVLDKVARWIREGACRDREAFELDHCDSAEVTRIAADLGLSANELRVLASHGPGAADLLPKMLNALNIDANAVARAEPVVMRDLQRVCSGCHHKEECAYHLAEGDALAAYETFCPNRGTLRALKTH